MPLVLLSSFQLYPDPGSDWNFPQTSIACSIFLYSLDSFYFALSITFAFNISCMERKLAMNTDILLNHSISQKNLRRCITLDLECIVLLPKETLIINSRKTGEQK